MDSKKPKLGPLTKAWKDELKRINNVIKRYEKKGVTFERLKLPSMPKKVTKKSVERLQSFTSEKILSRGNISVGNRTLHVPTAKKRGNFRTPFGFNEQANGAQSSKANKSGSQSQSSKTNKTGSQSQTKSTNAKSKTATPQVDFEEKEQEHEQDFYTPEEYDEIREHFNLPDKVDLPDESDRTFDTFEDDLKFADLFTQDYTTEIDDILSEWDSLNIYYDRSYNNGKGPAMRKVYLRKGRNPDVEMDKAMDARRLQDIFDGIKQTTDKDTLMERLARSRERLSDLLEIIMYKAYDEAEVDGAFDEFVALLSTD